MPMHEPRRQRTVQAFPIRSRRESRSLTAFGRGMPLAASLNLAPPLETSSMAQASRPEPSQRSIQTRHGSGKSLRSVRRLLELSYKLTAPGWRCSADNAHLPTVIVKLYTRNVEDHFRRAVKALSATPRKDGHIRRECR